MSASASAAIPLLVLVKIITNGLWNRLLTPEIHLNVKRSAHAMSMCHWRHVTCDINLEADIIQIMPGLEGDLEEWQTQEVNVTRGEAEGDIDLEGLPFLKVTRGPRNYLFCYSRQFYIFMHILIFTISIQNHLFLWGIILLDL